MEIKKDTFNRDVLEIKINISKIFRRKIFKNERKTERKNKRNYKEKL